MGRAYNFKRFIVSFLRLTRVWNLIILAIAQYFTAIMLIDRANVFDIRFFLLVISTGLIAAAGYIINDYYDIKIDLINKPERVIIGKGITRRYAILYHTLLSLAGVAIGTYLNWKIGVLNFGAAFLLWWYSNSLKRQPLIGNVVVSLLTALAIVIVDSLYKTGNTLIFIYAAFAFFITLIREVIKDMEDLKGDDTFGCRTLPIIWGMRKTKYFIYAVLLVFSLTVVFLDVFYVDLPEYYFLLFLFVPLLFLLITLIQADTKRDYARLSNFCKIILLLGVFSMAFL
ncbi:MAG TPA: geranylgeranylglycerol-phosphate geranylgeranyltransferase [Chryseosolibacter sp.]